MLFNILLMGESIILTAAIYRIMDWLLVQMTESYSETHNFTLRSARDDSRSSHIMVLLAQNLVNTHSLRGCAYLLSFLFWIRRKFFFQRSIGLYSSYMESWSIRHFHRRDTLGNKFKNLSGRVKLQRNESFKKKLRNARAVVWLVFGSL